MDNQKKNIAETIHGWIKDARSSIIVWMLGITVTAIGGVILAAYSDHNKISAHDNILTKDYPKYTKRVDSLSILPIIEAQKIISMEKEIKELKEEVIRNRETASKESGEIKGTVHETFKLMLEMANNRKR